MFGLCIATERLQSILVDDGWHQNPRQLCINVKDLSGKPAQMRLLVWLITWCQASVCICPISIVEWRVSYLKMHIFVELEHLPNICMAIGVGSFSIWGGGEAKPARHVCLHAHACACCQVFTNLCMHAQTCMHVHMHAYIYTFTSCKSLKLKLAISMKNTTNKYIHVTSLQVREVNEEVFVIILPNSYLNQHTPAPLKSNQGTSILSETKYIIWVCAREVIEDIFGKVFRVNS